MWRPIWALGVVLMVTGMAQAATTLYVAPKGRDSWSGATAKPGAGDGPLASLAGARDRLRELRLQGKLVAPVRVVVADGEYHLKGTLVFGPEDGGTAAAPVTYEAAPGAKPIFSAGRRITGFKPGPDGIWTAQVPDVARGKWYFEQLYVNGQRATRARTPNKFYHFIAAKVNYAKNPETGKVEPLNSRAFIARPDDIKPLLGLSREQLHDVVVHAFHSWESSRSRIAAVDPETNLVLVTAGIPWGFGYWNVNQRYVLENLRSALDQPGEWFLDRDGTLSYKPRRGEDMSQAEVIAPAGLSEFVRFGGQPELGLTVENITLRGLHFRHSGYLLPDSGHGDGQAAFTIPAVVMADGARKITLDRCEIAHTGIYAVWFRQGCRECAVTQCFLHDLGAGGVRFGEGGIPATEGLQTRDNVCDNNIIYQVGRLYPGCIPVWVGQSGHNKITHNDISDTYYTGISTGWSWGYRPTACQANTVDFNHIHHIGQGVLSDMGGVYTLGLQEGATVSNNVIHDVYSYDLYGRGGWGLYNDEGSSNITMENNLVYNVKTGTYHCHYGRDNLVQNNILANSMEGQLQRSRVEAWRPFTYRHNVVYWTQGPLYFAGSMKDDKVESDHNLYWNASGEPVLFHEFTLEQWQAQGKEAGSLIADPQFVDVKHADFHLRPGSPAEKVGFKPFDYSRAGVYGDKAWVALAKSLKYEPLEFCPPPPPPPPLVVKDDFELMPVGAAPLDAQANVENKGDSIAVTDETAVSGKHSLKITDAPGLQHDYDPHLVYIPSYKSGVARCSYNLRLEPGAKLYNEWRSWDVNPYRVGPTLTIEGGKLIVAGLEPLAVPTGQWFHLEVSAQVGANADGKWTLVVTLPGQEPKRFADLPVGNPEFKNLTWLGWSSTAQEKTAFYLDDIEIGNTPQ